MWDGEASGGGGSGSRVGGGGISEGVGGGGEWREIAPLLTSRRDHSSAVDRRGVIYAIGGMDERGIRLASVEVYGADGTEKWSEVAPMRLARSLHASVVCPWSGRVWAIGGNHDSGNRVPVHETTRSVEEYDVETNKWRAVASLEVGRSGLASVVDLGGRVWAIGGCDFLGRCSRSVEVYDGGSGVEARWVMAAATLKVARSYHSSVVDSGGRILVIGGYGAGLMALSSVEECSEEEGEGGGVGGGVVRGGGEVGGSNSGSGRGGVVVGEWREMASSLVTASSVLFWMEEQVGDEFM